MKYLCLSLALLGLLLTAAPRVASAAGEAPLSFNKATAEELVQGLDGMVDPALAQAIVDYRTQHGPFRTAEELRQVPGMSSVIFNSIGPSDVDGDVVYEAEIPTGMHSY